MGRQGIVDVWAAGVLLMAVAASGCGGQDAARISEVSAIQARVSSDEAVRAESGYRDLRAREMERDLAERQRFYEAISGVYLGEIRTEAGVFRIRLYWSTTLPAVPQSSRVRSWEELASDLTQLTLAVQIVQVSQSRGAMGVACTVEGVRPDLVRGVIQVVSKECQSSYVFRIAETSQQAFEFARRILTGDGSPVLELFGEVYPGSQVGHYPLRLVRQ